MKKIKRITADRLQVVDKPLDAVGVIRELSLRGHVCDESLYICNISDIVNKYKIWKKALPRVIPFYAVKCNDIPIVIQTLAHLGVRFDCASRDEISKVMSYGVDSQSIIYANPTKPIAYLKFAKEMGVTVMTVDCDFELHKIRSYYPKANLLLRIRCDAKVSLAALGEKFGCDPGLEAQKLIKLAKSLGLNMIGICFHVGSGCMDAPAYAYAIHEAKSLFDFAEKIGFQFSMLDIGGGFPGYNNTDITEIATIINESLDLHFPSQNITIIAEPGRFYVASAFTLACQVHSIREVRCDGKVESMMYYINDGVYGSFICNLCVHKPIYPMTLKDSMEVTFKSTIWGPTLDVFDQVSENVSLPLLEVGDFIIFENMGDYTIPMASCFNGIPLPKIEYFIERQHLKDLNVIEANSAQNKNLTSIFSPILQMSIRSVKFIYSLMLSSFNALIRFWRTDLS